MLPLAAALDRGAAAKTQRLKLNGRTKLSVRLTPQDGPTEGETSMLVDPTSPCVHRHCRNGTC